MDATQARSIAKQCQQWAHFLSPYLNRGTVAVENVEKVPASALLKEMTARINEVRAEYGMPPIPPVATITTKQMQDICATILSAGNLLDSHTKEKA